MGRRLRNLCGILALGVLVAGCTQPSTPIPTPTPTPPPAIHPGVDYAAMKAAIEDKIKNGSVSLSTISAVLVSVDGQTKLADYRNGSKPSDAVHVWSVTKSVTSALIGIAIGDKIISGLNATLPELLPDYRRYLTAEEKSITLRQLMTMTAGFPSDDNDAPLQSIFTSRSDPVPMILRQGPDQPPGHAFSYSSVSYHLVTAVLREGLARVDGKHPRSVLAYARQKLFNPLQIDTRGAKEKHVLLLDDSSVDRLSRFDWGTDAAGLNSGCCLLRLRPADMVKFGELYLDDGMWHGQRILPAGWVEQTMTPSALNSSYGLGWALDLDPQGHPAWLAEEAVRQLIGVAPAEKTVLVMSSAPTKNFSDWGDTVLWDLMKGTVVHSAG